MYPMEMPYFNTENPVVRDELWNDNYIDKEPEEVKVNFVIDTSKLNEEEVAGLIEELYYLSSVRNERTFKVEEKEDADGRISEIRLRGYCYEEDWDEYGYPLADVYDQILDTLDNYLVKYKEK